VFVEKLLIQCHIKTSPITSDTLKNPVAQVT